MKYAWAIGTRGSRTSTTYLFLLFFVSIKGFSVFELREMTPDFFLSFMSRIRNKSVSVYPSRRGQYITKARVRWFRGCLASFTQTSASDKMRSDAAFLETTRHPSRMLKSIWYQDFTSKAARFTVFLIISVHILRKIRKMMWILPVNPSANILYASLDQ